MRTDVTAEFTEELDELDVGWTGTTASGVGDVLAECTEPPVVGASSAHVSLESTPVDVELDPSLDDLRAARTGVTDATLGIAPYGSVVLRTDQEPTTEAASLFVDRHVVLLAESDVRPDVAAALRELAPAFRSEQASAIVATGPSATADMGALVRGAHGPETVHVVLITDR